MNITVCDSCGTKLDHGIRLEDWALFVAEDAHTEHSKILDEVHFCGPVCLGAWIEKNEAKLRPGDLLYELAGRQKAARND